MLPMLTRPLLALGLLCLALTTHAADLTQDQLDRWLAATEEGRNWSRDNPDEFDFATAAPKPGVSLRDHMVAIVKEHPEAQRILSRHGFRSAEQWADTSMQVLNAYSAVQAAQMGMTRSQMQLGLSEALRELENSPYVPEEQKQAMREQMQQAQQFMSELNQESSAADQALIRRNQARLDNAMLMSDD